MVTNPSLGSRSPRSNVFATITLMRSAILAARAGSAIAFSSSVLSVRAIEPWLPYLELLKGGDVGIRQRNLGVGAPQNSVPDADITTRPELPARLLLEFDRLDLVPNLDVVELAEADSGLEVRPHLGDVVLETTQRLDGEPVPDHDAVADDPRLGVPGDGSGAHDDTCDVAELGGTEHFADL